MRKVWLALSIALTVFVLSFSLQSGEASGELSGSLTASIHALLTDWFPAWNLELDTLHWLIRKAAHTGSYFVLGVAWTHSLGLFGTPLRHIVLLGLGLALLGELLQLLAEGRGPSLFDALVFNAVGYLIGVLLFRFLRSRTVAKKQNVS